MYAVDPKSDCPHIVPNLGESLAVDVSLPCGACNDGTENWLCLKCSTVSCSRYVKEHASAHYDQTKHCLAVSFSDLSIWCYACESYIKSPLLSAIWKAVYSSKFPPEGQPNSNSNGSSNGKSKLGVPQGEDICEFYDTPEDLQKKVKELAQLVRESKHFVAYSGAGISTSAKIPDYRGPQGVWTLKEKGLTPHCMIDLEQAVPTLSHVALVELQKVGKLNFVVSTNVDGLHRRAGTPQDGMAELHGNCYKEVCDKCHKEHLRTFDTTRTGGASMHHLTGRKCEQPGCNGNLCDTIIHFGEDLPRDELEKAHQHATASDLSLVLGTSMRVHPACDLPVIPVRAKKGKMVICNLQKTFFDHEADIRIWAPTDVVMELLMKELGLNIPEINGEGFPVKRPAPYAPSTDYPAPAAESSNSKKSKK